jgi:hypothetical protein
LPLKYVFKSISPTPATSKGITKIIIVKLKFSIKRENSKTPLSEIGVSGSETESE